MSRLLFVLIFAASYLNASSFTYTSCTAGTTTISPCNSNLALTSGGLVSPHYVVRAYAAVPSPFAVSEQVSAFAEGLAQLNAPVGSIPISGIAEAGDEMDYQSVGSPRIGLVQFDVLLGYSQEEPNSVSALITDGVHVYNFSGTGNNGPIAPVHCGIRGCEYAGLLPFDLGSSFEVSASAMAFANFYQGGSASGVSFHLLEADGTTPVAYLATPEPLTCGLEAVGCALLYCVWWTRRRRHPHFASRTHRNPTVPDLS